MTDCTAVLNIAGAHFDCELDAPHEGLAHSSKEAQAIWTGHQQPDDDALVDEAIQAGEQAGIEIEDDPSHQVGSLRDL